MPTSLSRLLLPGMAGTDVHDSGQSVALDPAEAALVAGSGETRQRDFTLGRFCAHAALAQLGGDTPVIGQGARGAPQWPPDFCGSITHTSGYAAAVAARRNVFQSLGLDAEPVGGVTEKLWPRLFDTRERENLAALGPGAQSRAATILFSAKEASFKAWSPLGAQALSFTDIHIELEAGGFDAISSAGFLKGRFALHGDLVLTLAVVPAR